VCAALIDQKLAEVRVADPLAENENRNARLRTLLPIVRGTLAVVLIVMTVLMVLSALGIQVGPLLAGAGVIGIAVGFGAQTLVRDLFSKFFYLLDDAFRVGEYIQSGSYKGTVEHLGVRSIRLRHHRGPLYTIPYGELGAVQNMSRDWVIDKMTIGLTYDADLEKARKLIKKIGQELAQNPEFAPIILEPLKMQGVEQFGDFAIQIRMKMKTKPGQQFTLRRKAYAMIKQAFAENGIDFAYPTVQVAGGGHEASAAAAVRQVLDKKPAA
jgi:small-conductance mechanosensitive channel